MHRIFRMKAHEAKHGPHFSEEKARKAVSKMENEDGSVGPHWSIEETSALANQHSVRLDERFNKYDWYVALNMIYSDYYQVIVSLTNSNNTKHFVEFAKAWLNDKDIDEGKMWYYYVYVMCGEVRDAVHNLYEREYDIEHEDDDDDMHGLYRRGGRSARMMKRRATDYERDVEMDDERELDREYKREREVYPEYRSRSTRYVRY